MPIAADDLQNLIGFMRMYIGKLESFVFVLCDPDAVQSEIDNANAQIASELQDLDKMITTITTVTQVTPASTGYQDSDLHAMNVIPVTSTPVKDSTATTPSSQTATVSPSPNPAAVTPI